MTKLRKLTPTNTISDQSKCCVQRKLTMTQSAYHAPETSASEQHCHDPEMSENNNISIHLTDEFTPKEPDFTK